MSAGRIVQRARIEAQAAQESYQYQQQLIQSYKLTKGSVASFGSRGELIGVYQFGINPDSVNLSGSVNYTDHVAPGMFGGPQQYVNVPNIEVSFKLFLATRRTVDPFSTNEENNKIPSIEKDIAIIQSWFMPNLNDYFSDVNSELFISPPRLRLSFGRIELPVRGKSWKLSTQIYDKKLNCVVSEMDVSFMSDFQTTSDVTTYLIGIGVRKDFQ